MTARVARHQAARGPGWQCLEASLDPVGALTAHLAGAGAHAQPQVLLLDCVSLWISNLMALHLDAAAILQLSLIHI